MNLIYELQNKEYYIKTVETYIEKNRSLKLGLTIDELINKITHNYKWSTPRLSKIPKPNGGTRDIIIFNELDSFYLRLLNIIFQTKYGNKISSSVFSYRKGVRCYDAAKYVQDNLRNNNLTGVKVDISNYFQSVNQDVIFNAIDELVGDKLGRQLLYNLYSINKVIYKNNECECYLGIMPGSALSAFMANYLLTDIDKELQNSNEIYARYSDDIIIFNKTENELQNNLNNLKLSLKGYGLAIKDSKVKYFNDGAVIDFLGLDITKDYIDVNDITYNNTKKFIKLICKKYKIRAEKIKKVQRIPLVKYAIKEINRSLFKSMLSDSNEHKGGRMQYILSNITRTGKLKQLDFYILDCLRWIYTCNHSSSAVKLLNTKVLESYGFKSLVQVYNLYKMDVSICKNELSILLNKTDESRFNPIDLTPKHISIPLQNTTMSFSELYYNMLKTDSYFYYNGLKVKPELLAFDLEKRRVRIIHDTIISGNKIIKPFYCNINGKDYHLDLRGNKLSNLNDTDVNNLFRLYLSASYKEDYSYDCAELYSKYNINFPFRTYSLDKLYFYYTSNILRPEFSRYKRVAIFMSYLYFHLMTHTLWDELDYTKRFIKYEENDISLILKSSWIPNKSIIHQ